MARHRYGFMIFSFVVAAAALPTCTGAAADTQSAAALFTNVCLPTMTGRMSEQYATKTARLHQAHTIWFPQSAPRGLRQYLGHYQGVSVVNMTDDTCLIHVKEGKVREASAELQDVLLNQGWRPTSTGNQRRDVFCDPTGQLAASAEANTNEQSYDLTVTRRAPFCAR